LASVSIRSIRWVAAWLADSEMAATLFWVAWRVWLRVWCCLTGGRRVSFGAVGPGAAGTAGADGVAIDLVLAAAAFLMVVALRQSCLPLWPDWLWYVVSGVSNGSTTLGTSTTLRSVAVDATVCSDIVRSSGGLSTLAFLGAFV
jgi:hypothetical protein